MPIMRKIAVVDDDPAMLKAIERFLRANGFNVDTFESAEGFLAATGTATCLILDINLGEMSGLELRRRLLSSGLDLPVIFITAGADETIHKQAMDAGCVACLQKPFLGSFLIGAIDKATGRIQ